MSLFKRIRELFKPPPPSDAHSDWFYHTKVFSKNMISFYQLAIQAGIDGNTIKSAEDINPPELLFNATYADVIKQWGKPRCSYNNNKAENNIQVLFYRRDFVYEDTLFQLQFYNNKLFFVAIEVGKSMVTEQNKITMLSNLLPMYITANFANTKSIPIIEDLQHNFLLIQDDVLVNICYLSREFANEKLALLKEGKKHVSSIKNMND